MYTLKFPEFSSRNVFIKKQEINLVEAVYPRSNL